MKFQLQACSCLLLAFNAVLCAKNAARLNVLSTNGAHIGPLYSRLHSTKSHSETDPTTEAATKKLICHYVSTSQSLPQSRRQSIYLTEIYEDLKEKYTQIFEHLYGQRRADNPSTSSSEREKVYTNLTNTISVANPHTKDVVPENAFVCPERKQVKDDEEIFVEYFVSEEYNVSDDPDRPNNYLAGRFIFRFKDDDDADGGHPVVEALAEEPATAIFVDRKRISKVELEYRKRRHENKPKDEETEDPICSLDEKQKARVCNLIFNSAYFDGELSLQEVVSTDDQQDCREQIITFRTPDDQLPSSVGAEDASYEERMFHCAPRSYNSSHVPLYWISGAYGDEDEVFVYRTREEHDPPTVQLENLFKHIRLKSA